MMYSMETDMTLGSWNQINLKEIGYETVDWIHLAEVRYEW
jgi:hypothetical protein